ncbi:DNA-binding protein [Streptococcus iniae]|uniref:DNA-binding protein n=1 Tax=Streptococcus iniae TaxID=1346 RepID=A0A1J0MYU3_STRIN|nr:SatD family protein [Streptococcus iniae]AGM98799.1 DNA-binding protein [Streptococcus iniae SF1]AHY15761.1 DNA-binding protein [Streptococcus iniae]AHY17628.1 DNA-binding protein [Streptococcus iniae]AJG25925.1 DNA-binding protein [Streptococcus iniae]APD31801.1 DNA-binding protein [Streptococcus iniae]
MNYLALIGDFIDSKQVDNRYDFQEKFKRCLSKINAKYQNEIVSKFSITLGDEFQGLLKSDADIFHIIDDISYMMSPHQIRYGIGFGKIITAINPEISIGADGPAYWNAREAINHVHQKNDYGQTKLFVQAPDDVVNLLINSLLSAGEAIKSNWRASQEEVFESILELNTYRETFDQKVLAEKLGLTASTLSKRLKSSNVKIYLRTRMAAKTLLNKIEEELL